MYFAYTLNFTDLSCGMEVRLLWGKANRKQNLIGRKCNSVLSYLTLIESMYVHIYVVRAFIKRMPFSTPTHPRLISSLSVSLPLFCKSFLDAGFGLASPSLTCQVVD